LNKLSLIFLQLIGLSFVGLLGHSSAQKAKGFTNPILAGFYPDPSICRVGSDYYLVNSTFAYFPGIPIFQSKDLVNWKLIGHVMDRPEQMNLDGLGVSRGIFAPAIRYNKGLFYVTCTLVDAGGNFIVTSKNPAGPWSVPVWIPQINGIDPSMFFDKNGKAYIVYNSIAPDNKPLYDGHRTIRLYEFDIENLKVIGEEKILVNGGTDINKKPVWIEGPHIFQKDGFYYLIAAEGGTGYQHSEVVFRSTKVDDQYISYENNPILTQRHLDPKREHPITSTGHADFVQTEAGEWWAVFLGCRPYPPYEQDFYNTGRETFLAPVKWKNGWPIINPDHEEVQYYYPFPVKPSQERPAIRYSGNFKFRDDFDAAELNLNWLFLRTPLEKWYDLNRPKGFLSMQLRPETCAGNTNPGFLGHRQQHLCGSASVVIDFLPELENEKAGLLVFQNEQHFYFLCKSLKDSDLVIQLYKSTNYEDTDDQMELIDSQKINEDQRGNELYLKIEVHGNTYSFYYKLKLDDWKLLKDNVDATFLSTRIAGGFVGCMYALYTTSLGKPSNNVAYFDWFEYQGDDEVYQ
jgi:xylan 1,4-beta-xylosidase